MDKVIKFIRKINIRAHKRYSPFVTKYPGFKCSVIDKSSFLSMYEEIFERGIYNFESKSEKPYILDCGANIGLSTIYLKNKFPKAEIVAFEPDPSVFRVLKENIDNTNNSDIKLVNKGLGSKDEIKKFFSEGADGGRIATQNDNQNIIKVEITRLSQYINKPVDFLKIDIEGSELEVLTECRDSLRNVNKMFIEYHSPANKPQNLSLIFDIIEKAGFRHYVENTGIKSPNPLLKIHTHIGYDNQLNIFAYRNEIA